ncbi:MAG: hypothetical protein ACRDT7_00720 [Microbacterium sp.]
MEKSLHRAGQLNELGRDMGVRTPFTQSVKSFCGECNNGWMSRLETEAQRILTPLILGTPGQIDAEDLETVALWAHKTALTALMVSSQDERDDGHGVTAEEYHSLYQAQAPLPWSTFWIGRRENIGSWGVRVTPMAVTVGGVTIEDIPQGYVMTVTVGELVIHGLRFTSPELAVHVDTDFEMPTFWPPERPVIWPAGTTVTGDNYLRLANGSSLRASEPLVEIGPWAPAVNLPRSELRGNVVDLPLLCGVHSTGYPATLVREAHRGRFYYFAVSCECPVAYLIETRNTGAHCIAADDMETISELYESLPGDERVYDSIFTVKSVERTH